MYTEILSALIGAVASVIVCLINNHFLTNKNVTIMQNDLKHLTEEVRKHNNYGEKIEELRLNKEWSKVKIEMLEKELEELKGVCN